MKKIWKQVQQTRDDGQKEYARTDDNVFANFERVAKKLSNSDNRPDLSKDDPIFSKVSREKVLLVYLLKHIDGIWEDKRYNCISYAPLGNDRGER